MASNIVTDAITYISSYRQFNEVHKDFTEPHLKCVSVP